MLYLPRANMLARVVSDSKKNFGDWSYFVYKLVKLINRKKEKVLPEVVLMLSKPSCYLDFLISHHIAPGWGNKNLNGIWWEF